MKKNFKIIAALLVLCLALWSFFPKNANNDEKDKMLLELLAFVLQRGHYDPKEMNDEFSKSVYKDYLEALDPAKRFFLASDIEEFKAFELEIDDQIIKQDLSFFNLTYNRLVKRMEGAKGYYKEILDKPFDYTQKESFDTDYEKVPYVNSTEELKDRWRKQLKLGSLSSLTDKLKLEEDKAKADPNYKAKSYEELEKETRESSRKSIDDFYNYLKDLNREDWFAIFVNAIAEGFDPHTNYFAPEDKDKFDLSISGTLEGIGARLQKKNDFTEITELISGGPAWRDKQLEPGDVIMKVAQGDAEPVDVVGMRLDDVVKKIKGKKGTEVRLTVKKVDGSIKVISIIRDVVEIEETYAKSTIVEKDGKRYGIIHLPKFYINFENKDGRDAAKDVTLEIERLKKENIDGLVMDLRDNGGGSLKTVVDIAGLFIDQGPVVQVKSAGKDREILSDTDARVQWDGPLVLMINNFSASASEILAAAMQDYNRGVVIGSKQSYGKGTVQNIFDLNQLVRNSSVGDLGAVKITTQKFYRINGGSTQLKGVSSDVHLPDRYSYIDIGERDLPKAMPWDKIEPANFKPSAYKNAIQSAIQNSKKRVSSSKQFQLIDQNAKWLSSRKDELVYSLNLQDFKKEQDQLESESKKYKSINDFKTNYQFLSLPYELAMLEKDSILKEKRKRWHEQLQKDAYIDEALNVLSDLNNVPNPQNVNLKKKDKLVKS